MLLIATALALLVIFAGMKLLAQTKKESLGNVFKYISWFIVIMGFFILLCVGAHCIRHCGMMMGHHMMMRTEMREDGCGPAGMMGGMNSCHSNMMMRGGCCDGGTMTNCCGGMRGGCCDGMMNGKCDDMGGACNSGMKESCPMNGNMHGGMKKDSEVIIKKK